MAISLAEARSEFSMGTPSADNARDHFASVMSLQISLWVALALTVTAPRCATAEETSKVTASGNSILLRVLGPDARPIANAKIHVSVWTDEPFKKNQDFVTDANGEVRSPIPNQIEILRIWARKENHVPLFAQWWPKRQVDGNKIPDDFTFELASGTTVGGVITDETGIPIEGVQVEVMRSTRPEVNGLGVHLMVGTWLAEGDDAIVTERQGKWSLGNVPPGDAEVVLVKLSHPDFINDSEWGTYQVDQGIIMPLLRDRSAVIRMKRGVSLTGRVTDPKGQGIANAVVVWGDDPYLETGSQEVRTDQDGRYELPSLPPAPTALTVIAKGWSPMRRIVELQEASEPIDFQLEKGHRIEIRFEDFAGNPLADTHVGIRYWRGVSSLYNNKHPNVLDTKIPRKSGQDGHFVWDWAPPDAVTYSFAKKGFRPIMRQAEIASEDLVVVLMQPLLTLSGTVQDAVTGKAVDAFRVVVRPADRRGIAAGDDGNYFSKSGTYAFETDPQTVPYVIRIEAEGYETFLSPELMQLDGPVKLDVKLKPTK